MVKQLSCGNQLLKNSINSGCIPVRFASSVLNVYKKKLPSSLAMDHFDSIYGKVYQHKWPSIRMGLLFDHKQCVLANPFLNLQEIVDELKLEGAVELSELYLKQVRRVERHKMRMKLLAEKRAKKREAIALKKGIPIGEVKSDVEVSDISDAEVGGGTTTDPESYNILFETDLEAMRRKENFTISNEQNPDLYDFVPCTELIYDEKSPEIDPLGNLELNLPPDPNIEQVQVDKLEFPENLKILAFPRGSLLQFTPPQVQKSSLNSYFIMNGASILPVLTLNLKAGDKVADICAGPGGKALAMAFTMLPSILYCIDKSEREYTRLKGIFDSYIPELESLRKNLLIDVLPAHDVNHTASFDKVLVDVPCIPDRSVLMDNSKSNIFKVSMAERRMKLPSQQLELLKLGLNLVNVGGSVVYTTSTLSPVQNDHVVQTAITEFTRQTGYKFSVDDLKEAYRPLRVMYRMHTFTYGIQVLPYLPSNFGPVYFAKINRVQ